MLTDVWISPKHEYTSLLPFDLGDNQVTLLDFRFNSRYCNYLVILVLKHIYLRRMIIVRLNHCSVHDSVCVCVCVCVYVIAHGRCLHQCSVCGNNNVRAPSSIRSGSRGSLWRGWGGWARKAAGDFFSWRNSEDGGWDGGFAVFLLRERERERDAAMEDDQRRFGGFGGFATMSRVSKETKLRLRVIFLDDSERTFEVEVC